MVRPCRDGDESGKPEDCEKGVNGSVGVYVGEAFCAVKLRDGGLVDEEWDAEPALLGRSASSFPPRWSGEMYSIYQGEEVFDPAVCRSGFREDGNGDGPG